MYASLPCSLRYYFAVSLLAAGVHSLADITLCGEYENVTDQSTTYTCKLFSSFTIEAIYR